jgi:DNA uptake protein ComE-like DNA-binding protein
MHYVFAFMHLKDLFLCCMRTQPTFWLYFSRTERQALLLLAFFFFTQICVRIWIIPKYYPVHPPHWKSLQMVDTADQKTQDIITVYLYDSTLEKTATPVVLEINQADSTQLEKLPMIGGFLAKQIVDYREALGGYYSLTQLLEIKYLKEDTWEKLHGQWACNGKVKTIQINTADLETLAKHPYLQWTQAKRIIHYRQAHGPFTTKDEIKMAKAIPDSMWTRIIPYLAVDSLTR